MLNRRKIIGITVITALVLGILTLFLFKTETNKEIRDFDKSKDIEFIQNAFKRDYYWLVENPEFSLDFLIEKMSPNKDPEYFGKLNFKILQKDNKQIGFTTYFKKKFYEGKIQFVYVDPEFRGKGYAKKLTRYAIEDLFKKGAEIVKLDTRTTNEPAIKVYQGLGFKETYRIEPQGIVSFEIKKSDYK